MTAESKQIAPSGASFQVAEWTVDTLTNRIRHNEIERKLEDKVMAVLVYMARHRGRLVTREELEREIWGSSVVGYDALTGSIAKLRKSLDDDSRKPRFIETVSKKGYRLIANVEQAGVIENENGFKSSTVIKEASPQKKKLITLGIAALLFMVLSSILFVRFGPWTDATQSPIPALQNDVPSVVVLPFDDFSQAPQQRYLSEGITQDVTTSLSKLSGIFIIAGSSARSYKDRNLDTRQIATELGVRYIVEGSVQGTDSRLRISVQLIDALSGFHLWAESYDRNPDDLFAVQDDITQKIASALSIQLSEQEKQRIARRYTNNLQAYDEFIRGQIDYAHHTREDNISAREYYSRAIQLDQNFARAYAAIALTHADDYRFKWSTQPRQSLLEAKRTINTAIAIDDQLPQAYWVASLIDMHMQQFQSGIALAQRAIELNPNYADSYAALAMCSLYSGRTDAAIDNIRKAMRLNPHYPSHYASALGQAYYYQDRFEEAAPMLRDAVQRNLNLQTSYIYLIATLVKQGQQDEAAWVAVQLRNLEPDFHASQVVKMFPIQDRRRLDDMVRQLRAAGL